MRTILPAALLALACALVRAADLARSLPTAPAQAAEALLFALFLVALLAATPWERAKGVAPLAVLVALGLAFAQRVITFFAPASGGLSVAWTPAYGPMTTWPALAVEWPGLGVRLALPLGRAALLAATALLLAMALRASRRAPLAGGLLVSACPACLAPPLAMAAAAGLAVAPSNPTSLLATLLDLAVPVVALASLAPRARAWTAALPPALAVGDLASGASDVGDLVHRLYWVFNVAAAIVAGAFLVLLVAFAARYRWRPGAQPGEAPSPSKRRAINVAWTAALLGLLLALAGLSLGAQRTIDAPPALGAFHVKATAMQWGWSFAYPDNSTSLDVLRVPVGREVAVDVTSRDVAHSLFVPDLGVQVNAIPGRVNSAAFTVLRAGNWTGQCAEYCGIGHTDMGVAVMAG